MCLSLGKHIFYESMMKKILLGLFISLLILTASVYVDYRFFSKKTLSEVRQNIKPFLKNQSFQEGDLIFQTSLSSQSIAIQLATHSIYSHCGILFKKNQKWYVFEAIQPVQWTPLDHWIARGKDGHFVVKRLKDKSLLNPQVIQKMKNVGKTWIGKNYDLFFEWSDDKIYCSELIWKIYYRTLKIELGSLQKLKDFDLSNPIVKMKLKERYQDKIPLEEPVISPVAVYDSELLETIIKK
jgi:hypothetical protein